MEADPKQLERIGKSPVPLFPYYLSESCGKEFHKYDGCLKRYNDPSKCQNEDKKASNCFSAFWRIIGTDCLANLSQETKDVTDEFGQFKSEFLNTFDNCLNTASRKDFSSNSTLLPPVGDLQNDLTSLQTSCSTMGFLFSRLNCKNSIESYKKCRKSNDVVSCADEGRDLAVCTMNYTNRVVSNCISAVGNVYSAKLGRDQTAAPPTNIELVTQFYKCLSS